MNLGSDDGYSQLAEFKARTPHTADGKPIFTMSNIWNRYEGEIVQITVECISYIPDEDDIVLFSFEGPTVYPCDCYSTREALEGKA